MHAPPPHLAILAIPVAAAAITFTAKTWAKTDADAYAKHHKADAALARARARAELDASDRRRQLLRKEFREWYGYEWEGMGPPPDEIMETLRAEKAAARVKGVGYAHSDGGFDDGMLRVEEMGSSRGSSRRGSRSPSPGGRRAAYEAGYGYGRELPPYDPRDYAPGGSLQYYSSR